MGTTTIPNSYESAGVAAAATEDFVNSPPLFSGESPIVTEVETAAETIVFGQVVGFDTAFAVVDAAYGSANAIGIAGNDATVGQDVLVYKGGTFNPAALTWDASYNTDLKKRIGFKAAAPLIFIKKILTGS